MLVCVCGCVCVCNYDYDNDYVRLRPLLDRRWTECFCVNTHGRVWDMMAVRWRGMSWRQC